MKKEPKKSTPAKPAKKRLKLNKETIRDLSVREPGSDDIRGGMVPKSIDGCFGTLA